MEHVYEDIRDQYGHEDFLKCKQRSRWAVWITATKRMQAELDAAKKENAELRKLNGLQKTIE